MNAISYKKVDDVERILYDEKVRSSRAVGLHSVQIVMTQHGVFHKRSYGILMKNLGIDKPVVDGDKGLVPISVEQRRRIAQGDEGNFFFFGDGSGGCDHYSS